MSPLPTIGIYAFAALFEIAGCFGFWLWLRHDKSVWWAVLGVVSLCLCAWALTRIDAAFAGRAFAAYGGIYIAFSLAWMWVVEARPPDRWDAIGALVCVMGAGIILYGPRA